MGQTDPMSADPLVSAGPVTLIRPKRPPRSQPSYAAELECLEHAQMALAGQDFRGALAASLEHGRRFPNGRLAEQREALRVRSLAGMGLATEAHRAAVAFGERFPRSVFLSRLHETTGARPGGLFAPQRQ